MLQLRMSVKQAVDFLLHSVCTTGDSEGVGVSRIGETLHMALVVGIRNTSNNYIALHIVDGVASLDFSNQNFQHICFLLET